MTSKSRNKERKWLEITIWESILCSLALSVTEEEEEEESGRSKGNMAAEAIISVFIERLSSLLIQEARVLGGIHNQVKWIEGELKEMQSFLRDADERKEKDPELNKWVSSIRDIAYDAEDILEKFIFKKALLRRRKFIKRYTLIFCDFKLQYKIGKDIEQIKGKLRDISEYRAYYQNHRNIGREQGVVPRLLEQRRSSPLLGEMDIVGLEKDLELMETRLTSCDQGVLEVISIVGMGGLGKTTLAKLIYNSDVVKSHFGFRAWVCVSQHCNTRELLIEIEKQAVRIGEEMSEAFAEERIYHFLSKRRYLIVMDDVWSTDVWDSLQANFPDKQNGSRILFTTRNKKVAIHADQSSPPHNLRVLDDRNSWKLFLNKLFNARTQKFPSNLEELGKKMVRKCKGLPLAIVLLRGLLSTKELRVDAWSRVANGLNWHLEESLTRCDAILALSYEDLPFYLKQCFLYFGLFPEAFEISKNRLIRLWVAEGIVLPRAKEEAPEDAAKDYIEELVARHIIQVVERNDIEQSFSPSNPKHDRSHLLNQIMEKKKLEGRNEICRMHDRVRELALSKAKEASFLRVHEVDEASFLDVHSPEGENNNFLQYPGTEATLLKRDRVRRLAVHFGTEISHFFPMRSFSFSLESLISKHSIKHLRSLLYFDLREGEIRGREMSKFLYSGIASKRLQLLRVLDLEGIYKPILPKSLGKLIHLRYLGLRRTWLDTLPSSVGKLVNLQTLDLKCTEINTIPSSIWGLLKLRHLYLDREHSRIPHRPQIYRLKNLQTLWGIFVGEENIVKNGLDELSTLRKLGMEGDLTSQGDALAKWISQLVRLVCLKLISTSSLPTSSSSHVIPSSSMRLSGHKELIKLHLEGKLEKPFELCDLPPHLTTLTLVHSRLGNDPMKMLEKLPNLRILRLWYNSYEGIRMVCSSSGFPKLEVLELSRLNALKELVVDEGGMPNLVELEINECEQMRVLPHGLQYLNKLKELRLLALSEELRSRALPNKGHDWFKIQHIPFIVPSII